MPEDLTPNRDELSSTTQATGGGTTNDVTPPIPIRPPAEPREFESLTDNDPSHVAGNAEDETQAS